jgi:hypothetical protein
MRKSVFPLVSVLFIAALFFGCTNVALTDYQPNTPGEEEVKAFLLNYVKGWNDHDLDAVLMHVHEIARIRIGIYSHRMLDKAGFADHLRWRFSQGVEISVEEPDRILVESDQAALTIPWSTGVGGVHQDTLLRARLVKEGGKWFMIEAEY